QDRDPLARRSEPSTQEPGCRPRRARPRTRDPFEVHAAASRARTCTDSLACVATCQPVERLQPPLERLQSLALLDETLTLTLDRLRRRFATELTAQQSFQAVDLFLSIRQLRLSARQLRLH